MQTRTLVAIGGLGALAAVGMTQLSLQSQDRQYKKTLQYMHDGRERFQEKMNQMSGAGAASGEKK
ncbi:hypothetical protein PV08_03561 [Exophiala spinifera]|uniref:Uncharacterized protein n=1 Tax=Exophiala spinifera TaxID=91928 RepID=A0A0D2A2W0_9EURO|nr:uncharacterized protein PV08_03561 [Exophiala spinifera]KIW19267.1 hypothetical protein PV08_03561 [Exophiala spinifera]